MQADVGKYEFTNVVAKTACTVSSIICREAYFNISKDYYSFIFIYFIFLN